MSSVLEVGLKADLDLAGASRTTKKPAAPKLILKGYFVR
jgi:hypothetical protein